MQIRIRETGAVMFWNEFRALLLAQNPSELITVAPQTEEWLDAHGADVVFEGPQASGGTVYQYSQRDGVEQIEGKWYTKYAVADMDADAIAAVDAGTIAANKAIRNTKLDNTDWTQLPDVPITVACLTAFQAYRQALRDLDMLNPVWPEEPAEEWVA